MDVSQECPDSLCFVLIAHSLALQLSHMVELKVMRSAFAQELCDVRSRHSTMNPQRTWRTAKQDLEPPCETL